MPGAFMARRGSRLGHEISEGRDRLGNRAAGGVAQGVTSPLALDPETRVGTDKVGTGVDSLGRDDACLEPTHPVLTPGPPQGPVAQLGRGLERDERRAPDDERLASDSKSRSWNKLGTVEVGVDHDRAARRPGSHAPRAARKAAPSSSDTSSMRISRLGGHGRARPSSSETASSRCSLGPVGAGWLDDMVPRNYRQRPRSGAPLERRPGLDAGADRSRSEVWSARFEPVGQAEHQRAAPSWMNRNSRTPTFFSFGIVVTSWSRHTRPLSELAPRPGISQNSSRASHYIATLGFLGNHFAVGLGQRPDDSGHEPDRASTRASFSTRSLSTSSCARRCSCIFTASWSTASASL